jgi:cation:H+ antiporter
MIEAIVGFIACALVIWFSGSRLAHYGDELAELTGMGRAWLGLVLMASVTSLPELFVGIGSAGLVGNADLAVGDVLGSCVFNLAIISLLDALHRGPALLASLSPSHVLTAVLGIVLLSLAGLGLYLPDQYVVAGWLGLISLGFVLLYLVSMKLIHQQMRTAERAAGHSPQRNPADPKALRKALGGYAVHAVVVIGAALFLPRFADLLVHHTGLQASFVGTLLLAASTSLPEIAVSVAALRLGSVDMAVSNLLGSNLFNILILALDDLFYTPGILLKDASDSHLISVFSTIIMTAIVIVGLTVRSAPKRFLLAWDTFLIAVVYVVNLVLLYRFS